MPLTEFLICDDHSVCRLGTEAALKAAFSWPLNIRKAASGAEALRLLNEKNPDFVILDLSLPDMSGLDVIRALREQGISTKILVLTSCENASTLKQVLQFKIQGLLQKTFSLERLVEVFQKIASDPNSTYIDPSIERLFEEDQITPLTKREYEVLDWIAKGHTNKEISGLLECSVETVKTHRAHIMEKIHARNTAEVMAWYLQGNGKLNRSPQA